MTDGSPTTARTVSFPSHVPTSGVFIRLLAATYGDSTFVVASDGRLTYAAAEEQSRRLAKGLLARGVGKGTRVGLLAPNGVRWVVGWLAASRIGAITVPINTYYKPRELERVLRHADIHTLLTVDSHLANDYVARLEIANPDLAAHDGGGALWSVSHPYLRHVWMWGRDDVAWAGSVADLSRLGDEIADDLLAAIEDQVTPADPMVIVYSSGSTSDPKGAIHSHGALIRHAHNLAQFRDIRAGDAVYTPMPLFWVGGLSYTLVGSMHAGATVLFEDQFEPSATLELIERERCTHILGWPHMVKALVDHPSFPDRDLSSVRSFGQLSANPNEPDAVDPELVPNSLGMTETLGPHSLEQQGTTVPRDKAGTFGRPVPGVEHRIVHPVTGETLPPGELGELLMRGYSLMQGLYKVEREDTFTRDGWYRTGDGAYVDDDGFLFYRGRLGDTIKSAGMNISPREVELALEDDDEVEFAFVSAVASAERGEDVAAVVVSATDRDVEPAELLGRLKSQIANYMLPRHVLVVADQRDLPWLESGKLDRRAVQQLLADRFATEATEAAGG